jgi:hypothetical protein
MVFKMLIKFLFEQTKEYYKNKKLLKPKEDQYPTWLYHRFYEPRIVNSKEEHEQIGKSWQKIPFTEFEKQIAKTEKSQASENQSAEVRN